MPAVVFHFERTAGPRNDIIFAFLNISDLWGIEFISFYTVRVKSPSLKNME